MSDLLSASGWECACACVSACVCALTLRSQVNFTLYGLCLTVKVRLFRSIFPRLLANSNKEWIMGLWLILCMHNALHTVHCKMHKRIQFNSGIRISAIIIMHVGEELMRMVCRFSRMFHIGKICPKCGFNSFYLQLNSITSINWWRYFCFIFFDFFISYTECSIDRLINICRPQNSETDFLQRRSQFNKVNCCWWWWQKAFYHF